MQRKSSKSTRQSTQGNGDEFTTNLNFKSSKICCIFHLSHSICLAHYCPLATARKWKVLEVHRVDQNGSKQYLRPYYTDHSGSWLICHGQLTVDFTTDHIQPLVWDLFPHLQYKSSLHQWNMKEAERMQMWKTITEDLPFFSSQKSC